METHQAQARVQAQVHRSATKNNKSTAGYVKNIPVHGGGPDAGHQTKETQMIAPIHHKTQVKTIRKLHCSEEECDA